MNRKISLALLLIFLVSAEASFGGQATGPIEPFAQKVVTKYRTGSEIMSLAVCANSVFAGSRAGLLVFSGGQFQKYARTAELSNIQALFCDGLSLLIGTGDGLFSLSMTGNDGARKVHEGGVAGIFRWRNNLYLDAGEGFMLYEPGKLKPVDIFELAGASEFAKSSKNHCGKNSIRSVAVEDDKDIYLATCKGLIRLKSKGQGQKITGREGLPYEDALAVAVENGFLWVGTSFGAARWDGKEWQYFEGAQYLLHQRVQAVAAEPEGGAWLGTPAGITHVEYRMMTFAEKAAHFEKATRERHLRYGLVSDSHLEKPGELSTSHTFTNDNDGLWTAMYVAAECYRYAATKDPEARALARESLQALMFLETVTGIPGLMARSIARPDEEVDKVRGDHPMQWDNFSPDKKWRWKGDTSSDEVVGHYYGYSIYYDLCADETEKEQIRGKIRRITDYIMANDYNLLDVDGQPTTYGKSNFYDNWRRFSPDRGLNSLEILSHLKAAYHITGDPKYQDAYLDLAWNKGYARFTVRQKINIPGFINHSDDELAFLSYYPLLKYETDPALLKFFRESIERSWKIERPEKNPLFNFIYGAVSPKGTDFDLEASLDTLKRISLDLVRWNHHNSRRADLKIKASRGRFGEKESKTPLPPDERTVMKWNGNPYELDSGKGWQPTESMDYAGTSSGGMSEEAGTFWLLPYWMGKYYRFIP